MVDAGASCGGKLRTDAVVGKGDGVAAGRGGLRFVAVTAPVAFFRGVRRARVQPERAYGRHEEYVAEVGVAGAAEVGVGEADDGGIIPAVACAEGVDFRLVDAADVVGDGVRVGADLHAPEGDAGPRERVAHPGGADKGVDVAARLGRRNR